MILNKDEIKKYLPHRDPFLFVDEIIEFKASESIKAKSTFDEESFFLTKKTSIIKVSLGKVGDLNLALSMPTKAGGLPTKSFSKDL